MPFWPFIFVNIRVSFSGILTKGLYPVALFQSPVELKEQKQGLEDSL